eukprot:403464-Hanusia_phi.AAC.2
MESPSASFRSSAEVLHRAAQVLWLRHGGEPARGSVPAVSKSEGSAVCGHGSQFASLLGTSHHLAVGSGQDRPARESCKAPIHFGQESASGTWSALTVSPAR